ncbi:MAG: hypothetical protein GW906_07760 [Epsilonproteobacteria bacterium]|nr:hypothetical protein [Campylobacterota bacterium]OIO14594.1 MAG: hypothetical protein AUJ81_08945 [Helicobacteraceae bacterium CG1_02_36_14]PIP09549.1 MAG: hypothetical protein COX50_10170 [Sulfurimonas sp. CG23_combo_of_CG06-09_8_20_14_all_36_33]PIS25278.1 MAG: hypothetical protein COT46_06275 [Sulfurimonas sp. CG08_land_8_20_14_0_20_36_33]PIU33536.1 MAG: hypothetical protein COT05_11400 [Sulfurimonas sp. CG07_land_8_20_14_0_80_36_56]PIV04005.1 MAG: hypothetical protein COS56_05890 [Sulfur
MNVQAIKTDKYLDPLEIIKHLENVEYILMAAPAPDHFKQTPIHFTIFLNTSDVLPEEVQEAVLAKFLQEQSIGEPSELMSQLMPVGFAISNAQDTPPMPMLLVKPEDQQRIPYSVMHVLDFLADSNEFSQAKEFSLTGWSYSYN